MEREEEEEDRLLGFYMEGKGRGSSILVFSGSGRPFEQGLRRRRRFFSTCPIAHQAA
jgi:hypothetical protein